MKFRKIYFGFYYINIFIYDLVLYLPLTDTIKILLGQRLYQWERSFLGKMLNFVPKHKHYKY